MTDSGMTPVVTAVLHVRNRSIHCVSCERRIARVLGRLDGMLRVQASSANQTVTLVVDISVTSLEQVRVQLARAGYPSAEYESPA